MKRFISIILAIILLASGLHLSVASHYCGGTLAQVKWSLHNDLAGCGMEDHGNLPAKKTEWKETCCQDVIGELGTDGQYDISTQTLLNKIGQSITIHMVSVPTASVLEQTKTLTRAFPPDDVQPSRVKRSNICVYRI